MIQDRTQVEIRKMTFVIAHADTENLHPEEFRHSEFQLRVFTTSSFYIDTYSIEQQMTKRLTFFLSLTFLIDTLLPFFSVRAAIFPLLPDVNHALSSTYFFFYFLFQLK